jgi:hypothetical protein
MARADYHLAGADAMAADARRSEAIENELATLLERWTVLEDKARLAAEDGRNA